LKKKRRAPQEPVLAAISEATPHPTSLRILAAESHFTHPSTGGSLLGLTSSSDVGNGRTGRKITEMLLKKLLQLLRIKRYNRKR
jgi:hypothetical protein